MRYLSYSVVALSVACLPGSGFEGSTAGECGALVVGGNTVVMYGVEAMDCNAIENEIARRIEGQKVNVQSGACWLRGEGMSARFDGRCAELSDQYESTHGAESSWVVPDSISPTLHPVRNDEGAIVGSVWIGELNLQDWLISQGLARVTCQPTDLQKGYDTCERLHHSANEWVGGH